MPAACRCASLLKLGKPREALMDANAVLQAASDNVKAHFRAGQAYIAVKVSLLAQLVYALAFGSELVPVAPSASVDAA